MSDWRSSILEHFPSPSFRLTLVADPDGLLLEEQVLAALRAAGFQLLCFDDPVRFRYAYETQYRQKWDSGEDVALVVVFRSPAHDLRSLPYDVLTAGRQLAFQLSDLFPELSYPVIRELDRADLDRLYAAYEDYRGEVLGDNGTRDYVLRHVFDVAPSALRTPTDALKHLLARHYDGRRVPASLDRRLLERLRQIPGLEGWPLPQLLGERSTFFNFLQHAWSRFLAERQDPEKRAGGPVAPYPAGTPLLPLEEPAVRPYISSLFLEGYLRPIPVPEDWRRNDWTDVGILRQPEVDRQLRFQALIARVRETLPDASASYQAWARFAHTWAEAVVLRNSVLLDTSAPGAFAFNELQLEVEGRFAEWMQGSYLSFYNVSSQRGPAMLHHVPRYLAAQRKLYPRLALVVVDGLAFDQWLLIKELLESQESGWRFEDDGVFAWVPTLTPVSRQSIFAGQEPLYFKELWDRTDHEKAHWQHFWENAGVKPGAIAYFKGENLDDDSELDGWLQDYRSQVVGLVVSQVDEIMHGMRLGTSGMHQQVKLWAQQGHLPRLLVKLHKAEFAVFITADHGNITAHGIGRPQQSSLIEERGQRALQFANPAFLEQAHEQYPTAIRWLSDALPQNVHVLLADRLTAFETPGTEVVCHGGISLEEAIVPFVHVTGAPV